MNSTCITEIVEFQVVSSVSDEEFVRRVEFLEEHFHKGLSGYLDSELIKGKDAGQWMIVMHWASMDDAKNASKLMMHTPTTEKFRDALDPKSVKIVFLEQIQAWKK